ncbi:MAG: hypothetical protein GX589_02705 [Deltaproteobacteria bacterium]|nr:hypothetical protein [Deltaproteobacteria bacterium]
MNLDNTDTFQAKVLSSDLITPKSDAEEVRQLVLQISQPDFKFEAGQSIAVVVPGPHEFGNKAHVRFYSIAGGEVGGGGRPSQIVIAVRRCFYIDEFSGEKIKGVASNYLCDLTPGSEISVRGPFRTAFEVPEDVNANMLMIGLGTGIAPFRAFVKKIFKSKGAWKGKVRLFYGARSGLEMAYMNDEKNDFANYYDEETFKAFQAVSPKPHMDAPIEIGRSLEENAKEVWELLSHNNTYVFLSGQHKLEGMLEKAFVKMAGSEENWQKRKAELKAGGRWSELLY